MKMNKNTYSEIMEDNITFLSKYAPKCMTTSHIEDILRKSIDFEYPDKKALEQRPSDFYCGDEEDGIEDKCKAQCEDCVTPTGNAVETTFLDHVNATGLKQTDKEMVKGVYFEWLDKIKK